MPTWGVLLCGGSGGIVSGVVLLIGFARNWFSDVYTYTIEGGEGAAVIGAILTVGGLVVMVAGGILAI